MFEREKIGNMPASIEYGPTARHRRLAAELRRLRESSRLSLDQAAGVLGWSRAKLSKIETAAQPPAVDDVAKILDTFGGDGAVKTALLQLCRELRQRGWWASYDDVLAGSYAELEDAADRIRSWQTEVVPGLLQTEHYARAVISCDTDDPNTITRRLGARMTRRVLLTRSHAPDLDVVLAEEVLRRPVGAPDVMARQLRALLEDAQRPNVRVRVMPIAPGKRPALGAGSLVLFEFDSAVALDTAYIENVVGGMYVEDIAQVRRCSVTFDRIADAALSDEASAELITAIAKEFQADA